MRRVGRDGFWADRFELCRTQMVPGMARLMQGTNYSQFYRNFEIAAGVRDGKSRGSTFNDGDFYKFLEGAAATLAVTNDAWIDSKLDEVIGVIAQAQETNGYLDTWVQLHQRDGDTTPRRFPNPENFEMYNFGPFDDGGLHALSRHRQNQFSRGGAQGGGFSCAKNFKTQRPRWRTI